MNKIKLKKRTLKTEKRRKKKKKLTRTTNESKRPIVVDLMKIMRVALIPWSCLFTDSHSCLFSVPGMDVY